MNFDESGSIFDDFCVSRDLDPAQREVARGAWNAAIDAIADVLLYVAADEPIYVPTEKGIEEVSQ